MWHRFLTSGGFSFPSEKDALMAMLYPAKRIPEEVISLAGSRTVQMTSSFHASRVRIGSRVHPGNKNIVVSASGEVPVHRRWRSCA